jgi:phosphoserine phosphatase
MNVYDFDGTIYYPDCALSFALWCIKRHPSLAFTYLPKALAAVIGHGIGKVPRYVMERTFFSFLRKVNDFDVQIERFWDKHEKNISDWYLAQKRPDDLIISASPNCIIGPIAKRLGVNYIATEYDRDVGAFVDNLMYAREKAAYIFDQDFPEIENFYSDSLADTPMALCAEKAHLITNKAQTVNDWPKLDVETLKKIHEKIETGWSVHL